MGQAETQAGSIDWTTIPSKDQKRLQTFWIPGEKVAWLKAYAAQHDLTLSQIFRRAIDEWMEREIVLTAAKARIEVRTKHLYFKCGGSRVTLPRPPSHCCLNLCYPAKVIHCKEHCKLGKE